MTKLIFVNLGDYNTTTKSSYCREVLASFSPHFEEIHVFCLGNGNKLKKGNMIFYCGGLLYWVKNLFKLDKKDVIAVHSQDLFLGGTFGVVSSWLLGVPFVVRCGGLWRYETKSSPVKMLMQAIAYFCEFFVMTFAKRAVFNSKGGLLPCYSKKSEVVYNGVDSSLFSPKPSKASNEIRVLYIGRIVIEKGIRELCQAIKVLQPGYSLTLVGDGPILSKIKNDFKFVKSLGYVVHNELPSVINNHDILVLPSYSEGLPNVVLEAMSCGKAVIATDVGGVSEMIDDGKSGILIHPRSSKDIELALKSAKSYAKRFRMGKAARQKVLSEFKLEKQRKELYETLFGGLM